MELIFEFSLRNVKIKNKKVKWILFFENKNIIIIKIKSSCIKNLIYFFVDGVKMDLNLNLILISFSNVNYIFIVDFYAFWEKMGGDWYEHVLVAKVLWAK